MNQLENNYITENKYRQERNNERKEAKIMIIRPVGYPMETTYIDNPEIKVKNKEIFELYAQDQWNGYKIHKNQYIFDQKLIPDFAFEVVDIRPDNSYITRNTSILVISEDEKPTINTVKSNYKFKDVIGQEKAKNKTRIIMQYLKNPEKFKEWVPNNILFCGVPGTGKTMLAQALANELEIPINLIKSTSLIGTHVGDGAKQIHELYEYARDNKPTIIFIDEIDAIALERKYQSLRGDVTEIVNALLTEMDGIEDNEGIITICATNNPSLLDYAIRSRFEEEIEFTLPDANERKLLIEKYSETLPLETTFDIEKVVQKTKNLSGRDLKEKIMKTALHKAMIDSSDEITDADIDYAIKETKKQIINQDSMFV